MVEIVGKEKKILVIAEVFAPEDFLINELVFHWKKQGRDVSVLTRNPSYPEGKIYNGYRNKLFQNETIYDVPISRVQFIPGYKNNNIIKIINYLWNMILGILWGIKNGKAFDSIYIYHTGALTFSASGIVIKKIYHKKVTIWTQDLWPDTVYAYGWAKKGINKIILDKFVKWIYSNCDNIAITSPGFESVIRKYCPSKIIHFIPQWSSTAKLNVKEKSQVVEYPGSFNFVFAGNIGKVQNLDNVIMGFDQFLKDTTNKEIWLNIIGDGSHLDFLREKVQENNMANVKFWGRVKAADIPYFYNNADVLIIALANLSIFNLTIPAKFQSYLSAGKPIFGIMEGNVADIIVKHNLGWVAPPDSIADIAYLFQKISCSNSEILFEKTQNMEDLLKDNYNRESLIQTITKLVFS